MLTARSSSLVPCRLQFAEMWPGETFGPAVKIGEKLASFALSGGTEMLNCWAKDSQTDR